MHCFSLAFCADFITISDKKQEKRLQKATLLQPFFD